MGDLLVGREAESWALDAALADAGSATGGVLISGEAGIGKTALVKAFLARARDSGVLTLAGGGLPMGGAELPFGPVAQVLRSLRRENPDLLDAVVGPQAAAVVGPLVPDLFADTGGLGAAPGTPGFARSRLLTALAGTFEAICQFGPTVLVVEDLQWVDGVTLALLGMLLRGESAGLLVLTTVREPGPSPSVRRWCATERAAGHLSVIDLQALSVQETERLLATIGPGDAPAARATEVHRRSGGNPFLIIELGRTRAGEMPQTVRDLVAADLEALSSAGRRSAAAVAVAGRSIDHGLLADVVGAEIAAEGVVAAVEAGLLRVDAGRYDFGHDLIRAAADEALLPADRNVLHERFGVVLAGQAGSSEDARALAEIAWHFERAGEPAQTAAWALRAAAAAERAGAFTATLLHLDRVLAVADDPAVAISPSEQVALRQRAAVAADCAGEHERALYHLDAALAVTDPVIDPERVVALLGHRSWVLMVEDRIADAFASAEEGLRHVPADALPAVRADALMHMAQLHGLTGQLPEAMSEAEQALKAATESADDALIGRAMLHMGVWDFRGDEQVLEGLEGAWQRAVASGNPNDVALAGVGLSAVLIDSGRLEQAVEATVRARDLLTRLAEGRHFVDDMLAMHAVEAYLALGRWDEAADLLDQVGLEGDFGFSALMRVRLRVARGDLVKAEEDMRASARMQRGDLPEFSIAYDGQLAELRLWQQRPDEAWQLVRSVLSAVNEETRQARGGPVYLLGLRAAAELAVEARARRDSTGLGEALANGRQLASEADDVLDEHPALRSEADGELGRLEDQPNPNAWENAARAWGDREPFRVAYSHWRHAEALLNQRRPRTEAAPPLRAAAAAAEALGARLLLAEIEALARRARIPLVERASREPAPDLTASGLTPRELAVLRLLAEGLTNREIGKRLYMSPKTASVHVTHIIQKLDVRSRVQAAAVAHRIDVGPSEETASGRSAATHQPVPY